MKKVIRNTIYIILAILMVAAFIYLGTRNYEDKRNKLKDNEQMAEYYSSINNDNIYNILIASEASKFTSSETGIILFCFKENEWCNQYVKTLNEVALENELTEIYYFDILNERNENSYYYQKIIINTKEYLFKDDLDNYKLYVPNIFAFKNGNVIGNIDETSITSSRDNYKTYWTNEKIEEFKFNINELLFKLKEN